MNGMVDRLGRRQACLSAMVGLLLCLRATASFGEPFVTPETIDAYLSSRGSPLAGNGLNFVIHGLAYNVDPRLIVAIAGAETTFGTDMGCNGAFNAWSWFWNDFQCGQSGFGSWEAGIRTVTKFIRESYLDKGLTTIEQIGATYCKEVVKKHASTGCLT